MDVTMLLAVSNQGKDGYNKVHEYENSRISTLPIFDQKKCDP